MDHHLYRRPAAEQTAAWSQLFKCLSAQAALASQYAGVGLYEGGGGALKMRECNSYNCNKIIRLHKIIFLFARRSVQFSSYFYSAPL